jgi:hypothetical protein
MRPRVALDFLHNFIFIKFSLLFFTIVILPCLFGFYLSSIVPVIQYSLSFTLSFCLLYLDTVKGKSFLSTEKL